MRIRSAVVAVAVVLLAGCGVPAPAPTGTTSPAPTGAASPSAAPTQESVEGAGRLPIGCEELLPAAARTALFGTPLGEAADTLIAGVAISGIDECAWSGSDSSVRIYVLADAEQGFVEAMAGKGLARPEGDAGGTCYDEGSDGGGIWQSCEIYGLVDGYWYEASSSSPVVAGSAPPDAAASRLAASIRTALAEAGEARPAPSAPTGALPVGTCSLLDGGGFRDAAGSPHLGAVEQLGPYYGSILTEANRRAGILACGWLSTLSPAPAGEFALVSFNGWPGDGGSWDARLAERESPGAPVASSPDVAGAEDSWLSCQPGHCALQVIADDTILAVTFQRFDEELLAEDRMVAVVEGWIADLDASRQSS